MNDRFKFRVWDNIEKVYLQGAEWLEVFWNSNGTMSLEQSTFSIDSETDVIIEQCTGLKDKNGKLCFEHDRLLGNFVWGCESGIVQWSDKYGEWQLHTDCADHSLGSDIQIKYYEIIGNIHE